MEKSSGVPQEVDEDSICRICWEEHDLDTISTCDKKQHNLHRRCLKDWIKRTGKRDFDCDLCRTDPTGEVRNLIYQGTINGVLSENITNLYPMGSLSGKNRDIGAIPQSDIRVENIGQTVDVYKPNEDGYQLHGKTLYVNIGRAYISDVVPYERITIEWTDDIVRNQRVEEITTMFNVGGGYMFVIIYDARLCNIIGGYTHKKKMKKRSKYAKRTNKRTNKKK